jgi:hypothetical protein
MIYYYYNLDLCYLNYYCNCFTLFVCVSALM